MEEDLEDLKEQTRWEELIVKRKFSWAGHMARRGDARRTSRVVRAEEKVKTRARPGRPSLKWQDSFVALVGHSWAEVAHIREDWRFYCELVPEFVRRSLERP